MANQLFSTGTLKNKYSIFKWIEGNKYEGKIFYQGKVIDVCVQKFEDVGCVFDELDEPDYLLGLAFVKIGICGIGKCMEIWMKDMRMKVESMGSRSNFNPLSFAKQGLCTGTLKNKYSITRWIEGNIFEGKLIYEENLIDVCILKFEDVNTAAAHISMLHKFNSYPFIAKGYVFDQVDEPDSLPGLAFVEHLKSFRKSWIQNARKKGMWTYDPTKTYCLGVDSNFQTVFGDVGQGMEILMDNGFQDYLWNETNVFK